MQRYISTVAGLHLLRLSTYSIIKKMLTKLPINLLLGVLSFSTAYAQAEDAGSKIQFPVTGGVVSGPTRVNFTFYGTNSLAEQDDYRLINVGVYNDEWDYESGSASAIPSEGIRVLFEASSYLAAVGDGIRYDAPAAVFDVPGDDGLPDDYVFILSVIGDYGSPRDISVTFEATFSNEFGVNIGERDTLVKSFNMSMTIYELPITFDPSSSDDETTSPGDDETTTPGDDETTSPGDDETTTPGDDETTTPGDDETTTPGDDETTSPGDDETTTPGDDETTTPGDDETTTPGDDDTTTSGDDETTTSGDNNTTTPGDTPTTKTSTGKDSQTTTGGSGSSNPTTPSTSSSGSTQTTSFETANVGVRNLMTGACAALLTFALVLI